jgi:hypothetical protein
MQIEWFTNEKEKVATIYETNITFNTVASNYFKDSYSTLIGFDVENKSLLIKPVSKEEVIIRNLTSDDLHSMSIKPSYGRINGKNIIKKLCLYFPIDFSISKSHRYLCEWNSEENLLKIDLLREVL